MHRRRTFRLIRGTAMAGLIGLLAGPPSASAMLSAGVAGVPEANAPTAAPVRPIQGSRVVVGPGPVPDCVLDVFLHLGHASAPNILVVAGPGARSTVSAERWRSRGAGSIVRLDATGPTGDALARAVLNANGVWFEGQQDRLLTDPLFPSLLRGLAARGGVIGGTVDAAAELTEPWPGDAAPLIPRSVVRGPAAATPPAPGLITWTLDRGTALVLHRGRQVGAIGLGAIDVALGSADDRPPSSRRLEAIDVFDPADQPAYAADFMALVRAARDRSRPMFPPVAGADDDNDEDAAAPRLDRGTLILHGGGRVDDATFTAFLRAAGGPDARIVCLPGAAEFDDDEEPRSYSAERLRELGASNIVVLHVADPILAQVGSRRLEPLAVATGVWIDGGRTYRFIDRFEDTEAARLIAAVLARDGVVGGSSAGCQVAGDLLVRGNPRTNRTLLFEGYTRGLGLLRGVVLDAHFSQRERRPAFAELVAANPAMLGIGVDEGTAIIVRGSLATVIGEHAIWMIDANPATATDAGDGGVRQIALAPGETFDLVRRKRP